MLGGPLRARSGSTMSCLGAATTRNVKLCPDAAPPCRGSAAHAASANLPGPHGGGHGHCRILSSLGLGEHENEITPEALPYLVGCGPQGGSGWLDGGAVHSIKCGR